ncbi:hypothetical protein AcV5_002381 [Taiwanofungus camphoratus]|nr:hypothetical protein AcV5_002381 [Antrodia cinnamomea]
MKSAAIGCKYHGRGTAGDNISSPGLASYRSMSSSQGVGTFLRNSGRRSSVHVAPRCSVRDATGRGVWAPPLSTGTPSPVGDFWGFRGHKCPLLVSSYLSVSPLSFRASRFIQQWNGRDRVQTPLCAPPPAVQGMCKAAWAARTSSSAPNSPYRTTTLCQQHHCKRPHVAFSGALLPPLARVLETT